MSDRRLDAMKAFEDVPGPPVDANATAARRARLIASGAATIRKEAMAREMRRSRTRLLGGVAVAASLVLAVGVTWRVAGSRGTTPSTTVGRLASVTGSVLVTRQGKPAPASAQVALAPEDEVTTTPDARARVVLASGANVEVAAGTRVRLGKLDPRNERVSLTAGEVVVNVPKLGPNESFRVETPDSEVTVHGTSFVVSFHEGATRVRVTEGVVSVKHAGTESMLRAGDQWPAPAPPAPVPQAPTETPAWQRPALRARCRRRLSKGGARGGEHARGAKSPTATRVRRTATRR